MKYIFTLSVVFVSLFVKSQSVILFEDFENGIPENWSVIAGDNWVVHPDVEEFQPAWIGLQDPFTDTNHVAGSTSYFEPEAQAFRLLITPQISLGAYGNILSWKSRSHDPSFPDWLMILVSTTGNQLEDFTDTIFVLINELPEWASRTVNLSDSGYVNQEVYLAFVNHTNRGFKLYVDDVQVTIESSVSSPTFEMSSLTLFPNPSSDFIDFQSESNVDKFELVDASGRVVMQDIYLNQPINVQHLEPGLYFVRIFTSDGIISRPLRKQ